jgi:DHA3 family multidrug efflux protein-like MFS transporter
MKTFYHLLANSFIVTVANTFVWFALTFWVYLETLSVISTSIISGLFLVTTAVSSIWFGGIVDHHRKSASQSLYSPILNFLTLYLSIRHNWNFGCFLFLVL